MRMPHAHDTSTAYCQNCYSYSSIDSGYGYCLKNPPVPVIRKRRIFLWFSIEFISWEYPTVAWCQIACTQQAKRGTRCLAKAETGLVNCGN